MVLDSCDQKVLSVLEASGANHKGTSAQRKLPTKWPGMVVRGLWVSLRKLSSALAIEYMLGLVQCINTMCKHESLPYLLTLGSYFPGSGCW